MARGTQDVNAIITWTDSWVRQCAETGLSLASVTSVTADNGAVASNKALSGTTAVTFDLNVSAVPTVPSDVDVVVTVVLSNGNTDVHRHTIGVVND